MAFGPVNPKKPWTLITHIRQTPAINLRKATVHGGGESEARH